MEVRGNLLEFVLIGRLCVAAGHRSSCRTVSLPNLLVASITVIFTNCRWHWRFGIPRAVTWPAKLQR